MQIYVPFLQLQKILSKYIHIISKHYYIARNAA